MGFGDFILLLVFALIGGAVVEVLHRKGILKDPVRKPDPK